MCTCGDANRESLPRPRCLRCAHPRSRIGACERRGPTTTPRERSRPVFPCTLTTFRWSRAGRARGIARRIVEPSQLLLQTRMLTGLSALLFPGCTNPGPIEARTATACRARSRTFPGCESAGAASQAGNRKYFKNSRRLPEPLNERTVGPQRGSQSHVVASDVEARQGQATTVPAGITRCKTGSARAVNDRGWRNSNDRKPPLA